MGMRVDAAGILLALFAALAGCAGAGASMGSPADEETVRKVVIKLCEDKRFADVTVDCRDGRITLGGTVEDQAAASDAVRAAYAVTRNGNLNSWIHVRQQKRD